jgi:hypothetical protein
MCAAHAEAMTHMSRDTLCFVLQLIWLAIVFVTILSVLGIW